MRPWSPTFARHCRRPKSSSTTIIQSDRTVEIARAAGAEVRSERRQGKGHVVRRMFADVDADIYLLVDGDATYDAPSAPRMIDRLVNDHLDMVVGFRVDQSVAAYRPGSPHRQLVADQLPGRRCSARPSRTSCPVTACSRAASSNPFRCCPTVLRSKPNSACTRSNWRCRSPKSRRRIMPGRKVRSASSTPGATAFRILGTILKLYRSEKPLRFFTVIGIFLMLVSIGLAIPVIITYLEDRPRAAAADRGTVDGPDDRGGAVGVVGTGAGYGDTRPARNEAAGLFVPAR